MYDFIYEGIYNEGYRAYLGDSNPYPVADQHAYAAWQRGYDDMVIDAMADDDWPME